MTTSLPQLTFTLGNPDAPNTIWITTDPERNRLLLAVETNVDASLAAGRPVPYRQSRTATGTLLYLDLSALNLSDAEFDALECGGDGWETLATRADRRICFAPREALALRPAGRIELHVDRLAIARPPDGASAELVVTSLRVGGVTRGNVGIPTLFQASLQLPPDGGGDLHSAIKLEVAQPVLLGSVGEYQGVTNAFGVVLSPGSRPREIRATAETSFSITFVYADEWPGFGAVCTRREAHDVRVLRGQGAARWTITRGGAQESPSWLLVPEPGVPILGESGLVELRVEELVTTLAGGPTLMLVSYSGVQGFQDGAYAVTLHKVPHVRITRFEIAPDPVVLKDGSAEVTLSFAFEDAGSAMIPSLSRDVTRLRSLRTTIRGTTTFDLEALGSERASSGNIAIATATATVLPVIDSFTARPAAIYTKDFPRVCALAWKVNTRGDVELISSTSGPGPDRLPPQLAIGRSIDRPQMLTLVPVETPQDLLVRRSRVLSAFQTRYAAQDVRSSTCCCAFAPAAGFAVVGDKQAGTVTALDTVVYKPLGEPVATGSRPVAIAFAPDGAKLAVANSGDGTVAVLAVTAGEAWPPYALSLAQRIDVGGTPVAVGFSPDGRYLYAVLGNGDAAGTLVVLERAADGAYGRPATITLGRDPRAVAVSPGGAQLFVPNAGDDTVSVIGVVRTSGRHQRVNPLTGFRSRPVSAAVTDDGKVLLVACQLSGTVFALDAAYPEAERRSLSVGKGPSQVALVPGGGYALVANGHGADAMALLRVGGTPRDCAVLERAIASDAVVTQIAVSPDAGVALIAHETIAKLGVLTLANYTQRAQPVELGAQPTDVVVTPDARQALAWHNALVRIEDGTPSTGYFVYDFASQTVSPQADGTPVIAIAPSPRTDDHAAYLIARGSTLVDVVSTQTYTSLFAIDVARQTAGTPRAIAVAADGRTLFVLTVDDQRRFSLLPYVVDVASRRARAAGALELFTTQRNTSTFLLASPDGSAAYAIDSVEKHLWTAARQHDGSYRREADPLTVPNLAGSAAISPDGARIFALGKGGTRNTLTSVDVAARTVRTVTLPSVSAIALNGLTVSPDGTRVFATDGAQSGIRVFDADSLRLVQTISWDAGVVLPYGVAVTPDGTHVLSANVGDADGNGTLALAPQVQPGALEPPPDTVTATEEVHADA